MPTFDIPLNFTRYTSLFSFNVPGFGATGTHTLNVAGTWSVQNTAPDSVLFAAFPHMNPTAGNFVSGTIPNQANWLVNISGEVFHLGAANMPTFVFANGAAPARNEISLADTGAIYAKDTAIYASSNTAVYNRGHIQAGFNAVVFDGPIFGPAPPNYSNIGYGSSLTLTNYAAGHISAGGIAIKNFTYGALRLVNSGEIFSFSDPVQEANVAGQFAERTALISYGRISLVNSGYVDGGIVANWYTNSITNSGTIKGTMVSGIATNANGIVDTNADGDFTDAGDRSAVQLAGTTVNNTGAIVGDIANVQYVDDFGALQNGTAQVAISFGGARDTIINGPFAEEVSTGIWGIVSTGNGADLLENSGGMYGGVYMQAGNDTVLNNHGGEIIGELWLGDGHDSLTNGGFISDGSQNSFIIEATVVAGAGNDVLVNLSTGQIGYSGISDPNFVLTNPLEYIINRFNGGYFNPGVIVDMGAGNDNVTNSGVIWGTVDLGAGNDVFTGSANLDLVVGADGRDSYVLGGGADVFYIGLEDLDADTIAGGDGIDLIFLQDFAVDNSTPSGSFIDLTRGLTRTNAAGARLDVISGFEQVHGTNGDDQILGSAGADSLIGGAGNDTIAGRGGKDMMSGEGGDDMFVFYSANDSRRGTSRRDAITEFGNNGDADVIDLRFDTNSSLSGVQMLVLTNDDLIFSSSFSGAGSLRKVATGTSFDILTGYSTLVLELDINGDNLADFSLELAYRTF